MLVGHYFKLGRSVLHRLANPDHVAEKNVTFPLSCLLLKTLWVAHNNNINSSDSDDEFILHLIFYWLNSALKY